MTRRQRARCWRNKQIQALVAEGASVAAVALAFGMSRQRAYEVARPVVRRGDFVWRGVRRRPGVTAKISGWPGVRVEAGR